MSKRIGTAIRCEEQRTSYLNQEYAKLIGVLQQHDIDANDPCRNFQKIQFEFIFILFWIVIRTQNDDKVKEREEKDRTKEKLYSTMVEQSLLAATLKQIYTE